MPRVRSRAHSEGLELGTDVDVKGITVFQIPEDWVAPLAAVFLGLVLLLPLAIGLLAWTRMRLSAVARQLADADDSERAVIEVLSAAPDGFYAWLWDGRELCSRHLAILLGLTQGTQSVFADVLAVIANDGATVLDTLVKRMSREGVGFEVELALADRGNRIGVRGMRITSPEGNYLADVIWTRDVTEAAQAITALEQNFDAIATQVAHYRGVLDSLPMPVWLRGEDLSLVAANQAFAAAVDSASPQDVVRSQIELVSEDAVREARALAARSRAARAPRSMRGHLVLGGQRRLVLVTEMPVDMGGTLMTAGFAQDQTPVEELEAQIESQMAVQREVLEHLSTAIAIFSTDTKLAFHNTAFARLWRLDGEWLAGQPGYGEILDLLRDRRLLPEVVEYRAHKDDELRLFTSLIDPVETLLHLPDGRTLRRVVSAHPRGGLILTYEDVTDTLALERSFKTLMAVQRETLDHLHEGLTVVGGDGRIKLFNPAFARMWGLERDFLLTEPRGTELVERLRGHFRSDDGWARVRDVLRALFVERRAAGDLVERGDGTILECASVPLPDGATLLTWLDVTGTHRLEQALRDRNTVLAADDSMKAQVLSNVAAEVRKPLDAIAMAAKALVEQGGAGMPADQVERVHGIARSIRVLDGLVSDILELVAFESGELTLELDTVDIIPLVISVTALVRERARECHVTMDVDCPTDAGWIVGDERRLKQVLFAMLNDSIAASSEHGHVVVHVTRQGRDVCFAIGAPRPANDAGTAADPAIALRQALMSRIVGLHGGRLEEERASTGRVTIKLWLPTQAAARTQPPGEG